MVLDEGISGVEGVTSKRAFVISEKRAATAQEKANRAVSRAQALIIARQKKAAAAAQRAAQKAEKTEIVPVPTQPESPPQTDQPMDQGVEAVTDNLPELPVQLDRPYRPAQHIYGCVVLPIAGAVTGEHRSARQSL